LQLLQVFEILPQAVTGEPFSTADSLLSRENTGNFRDSGPYWLLRQNLKNLQKLQSQPVRLKRRMPVTERLRPTVQLALPRVPPFSRQQVLIPVKHLIRIGPGMENLRKSR
jgi:hypothetical protein